MSIESKFANFPPIGDPNLDPKIQGKIGTLMKEPLIWVNEWFRERAMDQGLGFRVKVWQSGFGSQGLKV